MYKRTMWILVLVIVGLALVPAVLATQPIDVKGYFFWAPAGSP